MGMAGNLKKRRSKPMTDSTDKTNDAANSKRPSHIVYQVRDREGGKGFFTRIGAAWEHKDRKGFNVEIDCVPFGGRVTVRVASEKKV
jgi:hypothetical protein